MPSRDPAVRKEYYAKNKAHILEYNRLRYLAKKDAIKARVNTYRLANLEHIKEQKSQWKKANRAQENRKRRERRAKDPVYRLSLVLRCRISNVLRGKGKKAEKSITLLGCSVAWLLAHLEKQFTPGMSWDNYGSGWHIDHIRPCASFDLSATDQQKQCFHYTNLQPLWAKDNLSKGAKYAG